MKRVLALILLSSSALAQPTLVKNPQPYYVGPDSTEATIEFNGTVEAASAAAPSAATALVKIEAQLKYMVAPMRQAISGYSSAPWGDHQVTQVVVKPKAGATSVFSISYHYQGKITIDVRAPDGSFTAYLVTNPDTFYNAAKVNGEASCYVEANDAATFWYHWNPTTWGCPLKAGVDYSLVPATLKKIPNTAQTYPEYDRLPDVNKAIQVSAIFGKEDYGNGPNDPNQSSDVGAGTYREFRSYLQSAGYTGRVWSADEIKAITGTAKITTPPYVEEFTRQAAKAKIVVRMVYAESYHTADSRAFHYFYKNAIENAGMVFYSGHAGLGANLDLKWMQSTEGFVIRPPNRYQMFFLDGCLTYVYYTQPYFKWHSSHLDPLGTKNLDVITNGLEAYFGDYMASMDWLFFSAVDQWADNKATLSYQQIAAQTQQGFLLGINGDEDNPTQPPQ